MSYTIHGTAANGQTWTTKGAVTAADLHELFNAVMHDSFLQLTYGKAVYGKPGIGCSGPYKVNHIELDRKEN